MYSSNTAIIKILSCAYWSSFSTADSVRIITGMTGTHRIAPEWASITGMDIKIYLFYAIYHFTLIYVEISVFNDIAPFEVHMGTVGGLLHG